MTADSADKASQDWLKGLAGAPPEGEVTPDHEQGQRLRAGLDRLPEFAPPENGWAEVSRQAALPERIAARPGRAANSPLWRWSAVAATVLLTIGLGAQLMPTTEPQWRGDADAGPAQARWISAAPEADALALAAELRGWGAEVGVDAGPAGEQALDIRCLAPCDDRVAVRLAELETALAPDGRLRLRVVPGP